MNRVLDKRDQEKTNHIISSNLERSIYETQTEGQKFHSFLGLSEGPRTNPQPDSIKQSQPIYLYTAEHPTYKYQYLRIFKSS